MPRENPTSTKPIRASAVVATKAAAIRASQVEADQDIEAQDDSPAYGTDTGLPPWLEAIFPWAASFMIHVGVGMILMFVVYASKAASEKEEENAEKIVVPSSFDNPTLGQPPGGVVNPGEGTDPSRQAAQDLFPDKGEKDGWASKEGAEEIGQALNGGAGQGEVVTDAIFGGTGGKMGGGGSGAGGAGGTGRLAPFGTPGGGSGMMGPRSSFAGTGGSATRLVYILDHSGSMVDSFDFLRMEVLRSVNKLVPVQSFAVIMYSEDVTVLGPEKLMDATAPNKQSFKDKIELIRAAGDNDNKLDPFEKAFRKAFAMKPELIYFLTDGAFDPKLVEVIQELNKDRKVVINTLAFIRDDPKYIDQLRKMATDNKGQYKLVKEKDLTN